MIFKIRQEEKEKILSLLKEKKIISAPFLQRKFKWTFRKSFFIKKQIEDELKYQSDN